MFDLIGYWFVVSVLCVLLLLPAFGVACLAIEHLLAEITGDVGLADKLMCKVVKHKGSTVVFYNRLVVPDGVVIGSYIVGSIIWIVYSFAYVIRGSIDEVTPHIVELISSISTWCASFMGYIGVLLLAYYGTIFVGRQFWKIKVKVDEVIEKTSN